MKTGRLLVLAACSAGAWGFLSPAKADETVAPGAAAAAQATTHAARVDDNYRWHNNHWWYRTGDNWLFWHGGRWRPYDRATYYTYYPRWRDGGWYGYRPYYGTYYRYPGYGDRAPRYGYYWGDRNGRGWGRGRW